jgi:hypothetical protein
MPIGYKINQFSQVLAQNGAFRHQRVLEVRIEHNSEEQRLTQELGANTTIQTRSRKCFHISGFQKA